MITMHPGQYIREAYIDSKGIRQSELAEKLSVSEAALSRFLNGKSTLTPRMALALERVLDRSAESWMNMQTNHTLYSVRNEVEEF